MGWLMLMLSAKVVGFAAVRGVKADAGATVLAVVRDMYLEWHPGFPPLAWPRSAIICGHCAYTVAPNSLKMCQLARKMPVRWSPQSHPNIRIGGYAHEAR